MFNHIINHTVTERNCCCTLRLRLTSTMVGNEEFKRIFQLIFLNYNIVFKTCLKRWETGKQNKENSVQEKILWANSDIIEFSLNGFLWNQWIMTKSKSGRIMRGITHLATNTLPMLVIQSVFSLLPLVRYLLPLTTLNRYQTTDSSGKFFLPLH